MGNMHVMFMDICRLLRCGLVFFRAEFGLV